MASTLRRYSKEEFARRGDAIYERDVRLHLKPKDEGKFIAIDIETGNYEIDPDELTACDRLRSRVPEAQIWLVRAGSPYVYRFGAARSGIGKPRMKHRRTRILVGSIRV